MVGVGVVILAFITGLMALLGDLLAANRRLNEETPPFPTPTSPVGRH